MVPFHGGTVQCGVVQFDAAVQLLELLSQGGLGGVQLGVLVVVQLLEFLSHGEAVD